NSDSDDHSITARELGLLASPDNHDHPLQGGESDGDDLAAADDALEIFLFPELHKKKRKEKARGESRRGASSSSIHAIIDSVFQHDLSDDEGAEAGNSIASRPPPLTAKAAAKKAAAQKPAWVDEDTSNLAIDLVEKKSTRGSVRKRRLRQSHAEKMISAEAYEERLKGKFKALYSKADISWAEQPVSSRAGQHSSEDEDSEDDGRALLRSTSKRTVEGASGLLPQGVLTIIPMVDLNKAHPNHSKVTSVKFHPNGQLALSAGYDCGLRVFHVDGKANNKVQGVVFKDLPIRSADFTADGKEVLVSGRKSYFYSYSLDTGHVQRVTQIRGCPDKSYERMLVSPDNKYLAVLAQEGFIHLLSRVTKQSIAVLKVNGTVDSAQFSSDGSVLYAIGDNAQVHQFDMKTRRCLRVFDDCDAFNSTALALSPSGQYLATGGQSGVVNIYDLKSSLSQADLKPVKSLTNLTTPISRLLFNPDSQILAAASSARPDQFKVYHFPSMTSFTNWPTARSPLNTVTSMAFSPHSGYLSIGNVRGRALLYRLGHYPSS
ncbi:MAG: hypothetical protein Q8P67_28685, partial [archaeon]|nr:hypothetical protein [archaeon]